MSAANGEGVALVRDQEPEEPCLAVTVLYYPRSGRVTLRTALDLDQIAVVLKRGEIVHLKACMGEQQKQIVAVSPADLAALARG